MMDRKKYKKLIIYAGLVGVLITTIGVHTVYKNSIKPQTPIITSTAAVEIITDEVEKMEVVEPVISMDFVESRQPITDEFDVLKPSNITREDLIKALDDEFRSGLIPAVDAVIAAEDHYGVNALYLISTLGLESGWGKYTTGDNNIAGWKTLDGGWRNFGSISECIMTVAEGISTSFKEDVGSTLLGVTTRYCTDYDYLSQIKTIMGEIENRIY